MPLTAKGAAILGSMEKIYGPEKGKSVFYASRNAKKITGVDAADMAGPEWDELQRLFDEWIDEERDEPEHADDEFDAQLKRGLRRIFGFDGESAELREQHEGKLSERTRENIGREGSERREEMPESAFLGPDRTYPVKEKRDGKWVYTRNLLLAAERRAVTQGRRDIANRARAIREREFGASGNIPGRDRALSRLAEDRKPGRIHLLDDRRQFSGTAFDRDTTRTIDHDGRLRVSVANISKANVCPYWGREIPAYDELGLEPDRLYHLYRDPDELAKAAPTFNSVPILDEHRSSTADDHPRDLVIGTTGSDAKFVAPYLQASLVFWPQEAIDDIDNDERRQLSASYRYDADMTPGVTPEGEKFDGVMRRIRGNHVMLVSEGRAGPDVMVGDRAIRRFNWANAAVR